MREIILRSINKFNNRMEANFKREIGSFEASAAKEK